MLYRRRKGEIYIKLTYGLLTALIWFGISAQARNADYATKNIELASTDRYVKDLQIVTATKGNDVELRLTGTIRAALGGNSQLRVDKIWSNTETTQFLVRPVRAMNAEGISIEGQAHDTPFSITIRESNLNGQNFHFTVFHYGQTVGKNEIVIKTDRPR